VDLRIATWNLEYAAGAERNEHRLKLLLEADADVLVLTETATAGVHVSQHCAATGTREARLPVDHGLVPLANQP